MPFGLDQMLEDGVASMNAAILAQNMTKISKIAKEYGDDLVWHAEAALRMACSKDLVSSAKAILDAYPTVHVNEADDDGNTPLMLACAAGSEGCVDTLLQHKGTTLDVKVNKAGKTCFDLAAPHRMVLLRLISELSTRSAHPTHHVSLLVDMIEKLAKEKDRERALQLRVDLTDAEVTYLHSDREKLEDVINEKMIKINQLNIQNKALSGEVAALKEKLAGTKRKKSSDDEDDSEEAKLSKKQKEASVPAPDREKRCMELFYAVTDKNYGKVKHLVDNYKDEIDINWNIPHSGWGCSTALHWACATNQTEVVRLLLKEFPNIDLNAKDMFLRTPLIDACYHAHIEVIDLLLKDSRLKVDNHISSSAGHSCFIAAAQSGNMRLLSKLLLHSSKQCLGDLGVMAASLTTLLKNLLTQPQKYEALDDKKKKDDDDK